MFVLKLSCAQKILLDFSILFIDPLEEKSTNKNCVLTPFPITFPRLVAYYIGTPSTASFKYSRRNYYWCPKNMKYFFVTYINSQFPNIAIAILDFLYGSPFRYRSSNFAIAKVVVLTSLLYFLYRFCRMVHGFFSVLLS